MIKNGGGHRVCPTCGKTIFGSKVHVCPATKIYFSDLLNKKLKWKNAALELPDRNMEVLCQVDGLIEIGFYDKNFNIFIGNAHDMMMNWSAKSKYWISLESVLEKID